MFRTAAVAGSLSFVAVCGLIATGHDCSAYLKAMVDRAKKRLSPSGTNVPALPYAALLQ